MAHYLKDRFTVESEENGRLDTLLSKKFSTYSRSYFQYLITHGLVLLNGKVAQKRQRPKAGDTIAVTFLSKEKLDLSPKPIPLDILYEDEDLICINKVAGMVVHPAPGHLTETLVHALLHHCRGIPLPGEEYRPGIVHRLDKDTSGILIAAKSLQAYQNLIDQFKKRELEKEYLAITVGHPLASTIRAPIGRHPIRRKEMVILEEGGKEAMTVITPLQKAKHFSLISAQLITGRTHQIRAHLKHNQTPILGDPSYGFPKINKKFQVSRQLLHASRMRFFHPVKRKILNLSAPLPEDMRNLCRDFFLRK